MLIGRENALQRPEGVIAPAQEEKYTVHKLVYDEFG
jgi:hypothetical protein